MRKILALILMFSAIQSFSQDNYILDKPKVDKRIELLSIVFRLAGSEEFSSKRFKLYVDRIEDHFSSYENHELIKFARKMVNKNSVGYDVVMSMAIHIDDTLDPLVKFTDNVPDKRWGKKNAEEFVRLLKKFYNDAKCEEFFSRNSDLYRDVSKRFLPIYENLDLVWYNTFYGKKPTEKFIIVNGLANGGGNYGVSINYPNGEREVYAIMGTWRVDSTGMAEFNMGQYFPTLLHEFNHSFVNYLLENAKNKIKESGEKIYEVIKYEMTNQAYGSWETMFNEALVRAAVIKYMKDHQFPEDEINTEINDQLNSGFLWMNELVSELEKFDKQRVTYPTLESYMTNISEGYITYANNIEGYSEQFDKKRPKVVSVIEFKNNDQHVNSETTVITVNFDKPLSGKGYSINYGEKGEKAYPEFGKIVYSEDRKSVRMEVKLASNKVYQFVLSGMAFKSEDGIALKDYEVNFKTTSKTQRNTKSTNN